MAITEVVMPVILSKFKPRLEIDDYSYIGLDDRSGVLLLLRGDGDLFARAMLPDGTSYTRKLLSKVRRFSWEEGHRLRQGVCFTVLTNDRSLSLYYVNSVDLSSPGSDSGEGGDCGEPVKLIQRATTRDMKLLLKRRHIDYAFRAVDLVGQCLSGSALLVDNHVLVVVTQSQTGTTLKAVVDLDQSMQFANPSVESHQSASLVSVSCIGSLIFRLCSSGLINIYHVDKSKIIAVLDVKQYSSETEGAVFDEKETFTRLSVSPTAMCVATSTSQDRLCLIYLQNYYEKYPGHIIASLLLPISDHDECDYIDGDKWDEEGEETKTNSQLVGDVWFRRGISQMEKCLSGFESADSVINVIGTGSVNQTIVQQKLVQQSDLGHKTVSQLLDVLCHSAQTKPLDIDVSDDDSDVRIDGDALFGSVFSSVMSVCKQEAASREETSSVHQAKLLELPFTSCCIGFPNLSTNLTIKHVHLDATTLSVVVAPSSRHVTSLLCDSDEDCGFVWLLDVKSTHSHAVRYDLQERIVVALMARSESPVCLLSDSNAFICIQDFSQEALVNKVLLFDNAKLAERLCRLNHWERYSLPLNALERAVRHRQLDTIAFFLHSGGECQDAEDEQSHATRIFKYSPQLPPLAADQMETAIQLLIGSIEDNHGKRQQSQFAEQLLNLTLNFLQRLMADQTAQIGLELNSLDSNKVLGESRVVGDDSPTPAVPHLRQRAVSESSAGSVSEVDRLSLDNRSKIPLDQLARHVNQLRRLVKRQPVSGYSEQPGRKLASAEEQYEMSASRWRNIETGAALKGAIQTDQVPLLQVFLNKERSRTAIANRLDDGGTDAQLTNAIVRHISIRRATGDADTLEKPQLMPIIKVGTKYVLQSLLDKNIKSAWKLLENMGCDVKRELHQICFATVDKQLRDLLALELMQNGWLTDKESEAVSYVRIVERLYEAHDYDHFVSTHNQIEDTESSVSPPSWYKCGTVKPFSGFQLKFPISSISTNQESSGYVQLSLDWVSSWNTETRERILLDRLLVTSDSDEMQQLVNAHSRWNYYFAHNNWKALVQWIQQALPLLDRHSVSAGQLAAALVGVNQQDSWHYIPPELWAVLPHATRFASEMVLDELARHGQFCDKELSSFPKLLRRISRVHNLFGQIHPLAAVRRSDKATSFEGMIGTPKDFHKRFLSYCIKSRLVNVMYEYMDHYRLGLNTQDTLELGLTGEQKDWVHVLVKFRLAATRCQDRDALFEASLANSQLILQPVAGSRGLTVSVQDMLDHNRTLMAVATLMYAPGGIEEAISRRGEVWSVNAQNLHKALAPYPKLQAAVFADQSKANRTAAELQDVSVYELLQKSVSCDVSRLFRWQSTNNLHTDDDDSLLKEMPHFSHPTLVSQYSYKERLPFTYYLRKGRPSFAFITFANYHNITSKMGSKRVMSGYSKAYRLALRDFNNPSVTASCVAFVEMLGQDSHFLRVDIECANRLYKFCCEESMKARPVEQRLQPESQLYSNKAEIVDDLLTASALSATAARVVQRLEYATYLAVSSKAIQKTSQAASDLWCLVLKYCSAHSVALCPGFLVECAVSEDWLAFICYAQENQFPADKVLEIVDQNFHNPHLQEHLHLTFKSVLKNLGNKKQSQSRQQKTRDKRGKRLQKDKLMANTVASRDQRARLYTRIGVPQAGKQAAHDKSSAGNETVGEACKDSLSLQDEAQEETFDLDTTNEHPVLITQSLPHGLFDVLLSCQTYKQPWRAMLAHAVALKRNLLAILAACLQDAEMLDCVCVWLSVTCGSEVLGRALTGIKGSIQWHQWSLDDLHSLLIVAAKHRPSLGKAMSLALEYFDSDNLLLDFLHFHEAVTIQLDFIDALRHLKKLKEGLDKCDVDSKFPGKIGNRKWMEQLCSEIADILLLLCPCWMLSHFLRVMSEAKFGDSFNNCIVTDYGKLYNIFKILEKAKVDPAICFAYKTEGEEKDESVQLESWLVSNHSVIIETLLDKGQFDDAREYAGALGLALDSITERQALHDLEMFQSLDLWKTSQGQAMFWQRCHNAFLSNSCSPESAGHFFEALLTHPSTSDISQHERAVVLEYALHWYNKGLLDGDRNGKTELEKNLWLCRIRGTVELQKECQSQSERSRLSPGFGAHQSGSLNVFDLNPKSANLSTMLETHNIIATAFISDDVNHWLEMIDQGEQECLLQTYDEKIALEAVIGQLLDEQDITSACRVSTLFRQVTDDLELVVSCLCLAAGRIKYTGLSSKLRLLIEDKQQEAVDHGTSFQFQHSLEHQWNYGYGGVQQTTKYLNTLSHMCDCGKKICLRVAISFEMALELGCSYQSVLETSPFDVLVQLLSSNMIHKYSQAEKFIAACVLSPIEVAGFLSENILKALQVHSGQTSVSPGKPGVIFNPSSTGNEFQLLARLCPKPYLLGNRLLEEAMSLAASTAELRPLSLPIEVELMILSHECYTLACSMEGIASVLRLARRRTPYLARANQFNLMVHLLISIGRYREMYFIFDALRKCGQFEMLLQSGSNKHEKLKRALLEYLWRPQDKSDREMVALHLRMYRAVAEMDKQAADKQLGDLKTKRLEDNSAFKQSLARIQELYKDAAENFFRDECLHYGQRCQAKANLIALQIKLLSKGVCVIRLSQQEATDLMSRHPKFNDCLVVAEAYKVRSMSSWIEPLYNQIVIQGNFSFYEGFRRTFTTKSLYNEVVARYIHVGSHTAAAADNMKRFLNLIPKLHLRHRYAKELGFHDIAAIVLEEESEEFLNDLEALG